MLRFPGYPGKYNECANRAKAYIENLCYDALVEFSGSGNWSVFCLITHLDYVVKVVRIDGKTVCRQSRSRMMGDWGGLIDIDMAEVHSSILRLRQNDRQRKLYHQISSEHKKKRDEIKNGKHSSPTA